VSSIASRLQRLKAASVLAASFRFGSATQQARAILARRGDVSSF